LNAAVTLRGATRSRPRYSVWRSRGWSWRAGIWTRGWNRGRGARFLNYANPTDLFALHKAALVLRGLIPEGEPGTPIAEVLRGKGGIRLSTAVQIPMGSGLGVSSILAGAVLAAR
jgi:hypothetical protein